MMVIRTDDNTRFFADRCSYTFRKLSKGEAKKRISGSNPTSQLPGEVSIGEKAAFLASCRSLL